MVKNLLLKHGRRTPLEDKTWRPSSSSSSASPHLFPSTSLPLPFFFLLWNTHYSGSFLSINLGNFYILNPLIASNLFIPCHFYSDCCLYFKIIEVFPIISFRFIKKYLSLQRCKSGVVALTLEPRSRMCSLSELPTCLFLHGYPLQSFYLSYISFFLWKTTISPWKEHLSSDLGPFSRIQDESPTPRS